MPIINNQDDFDPIMDGADADTIAAAIVGPASVTMTIVVNDRNHARWVFNDLGEVAAQASVDVRFRVESDDGECRL